MSLLRLLYFIFVCFPHNTLYITLLTCSGIMLLFLLVSLSSHVQKTATSGTLADESNNNQCCCDVVLMTLMNLSDSNLFDYVLLGRETT